MRRNEFDRKPANPIEEVGDQCGGTGRQIDAVQTRGGAHRQQRQAGTRRDRTIQSRRVDAGRYVEARNVEIDARGPNGKPQPSIGVRHEVQLIVERVQGVERADKAIVRLVVGVSHTGNFAADDRRIETRQGAVVGIDPEIDAGVG